MKHARNFRSVLITFGKYPLPQLLAMAENQTKTEPQLAMAKQTEAEQKPEAEQKSEAEQQKNDVAIEALKSPLGESV